MRQWLGMVMQILWVFGAYSPTLSASQPIPSAYRAVAFEYGIPARLFYAVALTESGQSSLSQKQWRPWPWTLNINGQGHYYPSRQAAWTKLQQALKDKQTAVDVGLMQIAWRYHRQALGSAWQALEPLHNLRVGAGILKRCYARMTDWWQSLGCYHAPNDPDRARKYRERVRQHWQQLAKTDLPVSTP